MRNICVLFYYICLIPLSAASDTGPRTFAIFGFTEASCGAWVKSQENEAVRQTYLFWFRGFASGHNFASHSHQVPPGGMPDNETLSLFIDKYCRENPLDTFDKAAFSLVQQIRKVSN